MYMKSPFKFLDSYTKEDKNIFFGRDKETEELYQKVFESKVLLVYGVSGTGKSSLIHCGLANKFNESDWLPINIRRGANINVSLGRAIEKEITSTSFRNDNKKGLSLKKLLRNLYLDNFKPIYLIFDQFEELFIFGSKPEREDFIKSVKSIVDSDLNCKFLFVIREEYLAGITEFEKQLPQIMLNRIRIEKMGRTNAIQAIEGPCKFADISLENGFSEALIEKLSPDSAEVELTYLQVYLDKLFKVSDSGFTKDLIESFGDVKDLLGSFLDEQIAELESPDEGLTILKAFVSTKGTKRQITESEVTDYALTLGKQIESEQLRSLIQKFIALRILRDKDENNRYELRHDALAAKIYEKITLVEKELLEVRQFIEHAYENYKRRKVLLNKTDLSYIAPYEDKIYFGKNLQEFLNKSKYEDEKAKRRKRILISTAAIILLLIFAGFSWWALNERSKAQDKEKLANELYIKSQANNFNFLAIEVLETNPTKALGIAEYAYSLDSNNKNIYQNLLNIYYNYPIYKRIIKRLNNEISSVCFSPDGKTLITGSWDNTARLWDLNGNLLQIFKGHKYEITSVSFSPDGKTILTGSLDMTARLWDLDGKQLQVFKGHEGSIHSVCFSPDGKKLLTGSFDKTARLWNLDGNQLQVFKGHESIIVSVCFSPDGKTILTGSSDKTARLWDLDGKQLQVFKGHKSSINSVCFSPNGKTILTGSNDKTARLWDLDGKQLQVFKGHKSFIRSVCFSPNGQTLLTGSFDNTARLWGLDGNQLQVFKGHKMRIHSVCFSPDGKTLLTGSWNNVHLWDMGGNLLQVFKGHESSIRSVCFSPDGKTLLTGSDDKTVRLWDLDGKQLQVFKGHESGIHSVCFSPDGKTLITGSWDNTARLWDLDGNQLQRFNMQEISSMCFSPDGKTLLTGSWDNTLNLWDWDGNQLQVFKGHEGNIILVCFSPDGKTILTGSVDKTARLWDLDGNQLQVFKGHEDDIYTVCFHTDGKTILTGSRDKTARLWDLDGNQLQVFKGHEGSISSVCFSPDGKSIITGSSDDDKLILWDLEGHQLQLFANLGFSSNMIDFSPDGKTILIGLENGTAQLWKLKTPYNKFKQKDKYPKLSITDKLEYGIYNFNDVKKTENKNELFQAAMFYFENYNREPKRNYDYLNNAEFIFNKLYNISKDVNYLIQYQKLILIKYLQKADEKLIDKSKKIHKKLLEYYDMKYLWEIIREYDSLLEKYSENVNISEFNFHKKRLDIYKKTLNHKDATKETKKTISLRLSKDSYNLLLDKKYEEAKQAALLAKQANPNNTILYTNLALAYLLTDDWQKAKEVYTNWKDSTYINNNNPERKCRDAFLEGLKELESEGITHPDFSKVRELLKEEKTETNE